MPCVVVVEYEFDPPITDEGLKTMSVALDPCVHARNIHHLRSLFSKDGRRGYCELEAPDAETVREAYRSARVAFRAVWTSVLIEGRLPAPELGGRRWDQVRPEK